MINYVILVVEMKIVVVIEESRILYVNFNIDVVFLAFLCKLCYTM